MQERLLAFFQFANSVTFKGHLKEFFEKKAASSAKNRMSCWVDGADSLAKRERGELQLQFRTEDLNFCLSVVATKLFELSGLRMLEEEVWRL